MDPLTYLEMADQRLHELRDEADRARLAAEVRRARPRRSHVDRLRRIASRWQRSSAATTAPATVTPTRRSKRHPGATAGAQQPHQQRMTGPLLMVASAASWAAGLVLTKVTLDHSGAAPRSVLLVQLAASVGVLAVACLAAGVWPRGGWRHGWVGLLEPGVAYQLALAGLALTSAANASVLGSLEPVMVPLVAWLLLRDRPRPGLLVLVAGATVGSALVSLPAGNANGSLAGDALVVASVAAAALYVVVASRQVTAVRPLPAALSQQAWALGFVAVTHLALSGGAFWPRLGLDGLMLAALSGVVNYAVPFWLYLSALTRMPVARAATYLTLIPVFGVLGSVALLGERIGWPDVLGSALVVGSLLYDATTSARADVTATRPAEVAGR